MLKHTETSRPTFTGERMVNHPKSDLYRSHMNRYRFARPFVAGKRVLDIACGVGFGSFLLSETAAEVVGVDVDADSINYNRANFKRENLHFIEADAAQFSDSLEERFDVIVSFETIEHIADWRAFLTNLQAYLSGGRGRILLSTPNNFRRIPPPAGSYHTREFDVVELHAALASMFPSFEIALFGQNQTPFHRFQTETRPEQNENAGRRLLARLLRWLYDFDFKHTRLLQKLEGTRFYQKIGAFQRSYKRDFEVYQITDLDGNFANPETSIYVLVKN